MSAILSLSSSSLPMTDDVSRTKKIGADGDRDSGLAGFGPPSQEASGIDDLLVIVERPTSRTSHVFDVVTHQMYIYIYMCVCVSICFTVSAL